ncbi:MAG: S4 domain-containing protein [Vicinamibacteraceae bacterium]
MGTRLDVWLDVSCLFKTRSEAQRACQGGKIEVNGQDTAKPHRELKPGDRLTISRPGGRRQQVVVKAIADHHMAKAQARELYEDVTRPPTAQEQAVADILRAGRMTMAPSMPDKRERRERRRIRGLD